MNATATVERTLSETIDSIETKYADTFDNVTKSVTDRVNTFNDGIIERFERVEANVPELPKKVVAYNRVVVERMIAQSRRNNDLVIDSFRPVVKMADSGVRTVVGTTKWAVEQTAGTAVTGVKSIIGQTRAQVRRTADTLNDQTVDFVDEATERVVEAEKSVERAALKSMTKAELYQMAQDIDIDGRADMNKSELIAAINDAG